MIFRFWYENGGFESSFTPAQLQQVRHITLAQVLCYTMDEIETIQPFVFLSADTFRNVRLPCNSPLIDNLDLSAWAEREFDINNNIDFKRELEFPDLTLQRAKRSKTKTKTSTTRPKTTTKTKTKTKRKQANSGFKVKITNVTTSSVKLENKYGGGNGVTATTIPPKPVYRPSSYHTDDDGAEVTYLTGVVPTKTAQKPPVSPLEVNIKIQYYLPTVEQTTTIRPTRKKSKNPTRRPANFYGETVLITQRPPNRNPQNSYPNVVQSHTYDYSTLRPNDLYEKPTNKPRPVNIDDRPIYTNRPVQIYDEDHFNEYRPSTNFYKPMTGTYTYNDPPSKKPYIVTPQASYQTDYEDLPFSTSQRPYTYDPYPTRRPSFRPQQNGYDDQVYDYIKRPTNQDKFDPINDVYEPIFNEHDRVGDVPKKPVFGQNDYTKYPDRTGDIPKRPTFGQSDRTDTRYPDRIGNPTKIYSIAHVHKLDNDQIDDKLDFKTRLVSRPKDRDDYDRRFVKISSVKAGVIVTDGNGESYTIQERDGEMELGEERSEKEDKIRVVDIEVSPSEVE